ncbi:MAG: SurA N-terminal domain-containing protein, partial [SAR86 cluster bacterium]|nr:SurA N-terminal domain-containing protein [SAR86 cluster bacterium]
MSGIQTIRDGLSGNITRVIVIAIIITFIGSVGWAGFFSQGNANVIAKVGSREITNANLSFELSSQQYALSQRFPDQTIEDELLLNLSTDVLIGKYAVLDFLENNELILTDSFVYDQLSSEDQFLETGKFSKNRFDAFARSNGFIPSDYLQRVREDLVINIWRQSLANSNFITDTEVTKSVELAEQERDISFI